MAFFAPHIINIRPKEIKMKIFHANFKTAGLAALMCIGASNAQFNETGRWLSWSENLRYYSAYVNFSATVSPHQTWTSPDHGGALKGTVFQLSALPTSNRCYMVETRAAHAGSLDTKIWTYQTSPNYQPLADDPDGQLMAKFVSWGNGQFIISPYSVNGNTGSFQLFSTNVQSITTEAACSAYRPNWGYVREGQVIRYR